MATAKERAEFIARLAREFPATPLYDITTLGRKLMRLAKVHRELLALPAVSSQPLLDEARTARLSANEKRICELCAPYPVTVHFFRNAHLRPRAPSVDIIISKGGVPAVVNIIGVPQ